MKDPSQIKDQIVKNGFWNIISSFINRIGGFILIIILSRLLMPEGFGRYSLAMTISLFFITLSDMGINQTLIRYVSLKIDKDNIESASYLNYLFKIKFFVTLFLSMILFFAAYPLSYYLFRDPFLFFPLFILSFYVFFTSLTTFFESLFFIKKNVNYISMKEFISFFLKVIGIFIIGFLIKVKFHLNGILITFVIISIPIFLFVFYLSRHTYPFLFKGIKKTINKKGILKFILFLNIQNISLMILSQATIILLGIFLIEKYVGYYNSSWVLITGISALLFSFSFTLLPIYTNVKKDKFEYILKKTFRLFFLFALPISFGLSFLSKYFISLIYGTEYLPASISLKILALLIPFISGVNLSLTSFSARNKLKKFSIIMLICAFISIILNFIFIEIFINIFSLESVIFGVSIANLITWALCFIFSIFLLKKEFNIKVISFWIIKPLISCLIMSLFLFVILKISPNLNIILGFLIISSSAMIYIISLFLMKGINKEDINILKILFKLNKKNNLS